MIHFLKSHFLNPEVLNFTKKMFPAPTRVPWAFFGHLCSHIEFPLDSKNRENRGRGNLFGHNFSDIDIFSTNEVSKFEIFHFANIKTGHILIGQL